MSTELAFLVGIACLVAIRMLILPPLIGFQDNAPNDERAAYWREMLAPYTSYSVLPLVDGRLIRDVPPESREQVQERLAAARAECRLIEAELDAEAIRAV